MDNGSLPGGPGEFHIFEKKRNQATASSKVVLDDELDHYGMYPQHNNHGLSTEGIAGNARVNWTGYHSFPECGVL